MPAERVIVARNPEEQSKLPYLIWLPVDGGVVLKAREPWPTTSRVYCHELDGWPADAEVVEEVEVRSCRRRGACHAGGPRAATTS